MIARLISTLFNLLTQPYIQTQKYILVTLQPYIPRHFDERSLYALFGFIALLACVLAYVLGRCVTLRDADDDPVYQRARLYSLQRQHQKAT